jgi:hypothetical protein
LQEQKRYFDTKPPSVWRVISRREGMPYYHATDRARLPSILRYGLGGEIGRRRTGHSFRGLPELVLPLQETVIQRDTFIGRNDYRRGSSEAGQSLSLILPTAKYSFAKFTNDTNPADFEGGNVTEGAMAHLGRIAAFAALLVGPTIPALAQEIFPALVARPTGEADIATMGPNQELIYH